MNQRKCPQCDFVVELPAITDEERRVGTYAAPALAEFQSNVHMQMAHPKPLPKGKKQ